MTESKEQEFFEFQLESQQHFCLGIEECVYTFALYFYSHIVEAGPIGVVFCVQGVSAVGASDGESGVGQHHDSHHPQQDHAPQVAPEHHLLLTLPLHIQAGRRVSSQPPHSFTPPHPVFLHTGTPD